MPSIYDRQKSPSIPLFQRGKTTAMPARMPLNPVSGLPVCSSLWKREVGRDVRWRRIGNAFDIRPSKISLNPPFPKGEDNRYDDADAVEAGSASPANVAPVIPRHSCDTRSSSIKVRSTMRPARYQCHTRWRYWPQSDSWIISYK